MSDYEKEVNEMHTMTQEYVHQLTKIWEIIFAKDECKENLRKLVGHARDFYKDLVNESKERLSYIEQEIIALNDEAETLKRLLKVDVDLPQYENGKAPLLVIQSEMDKSLEDLREQLRIRKEQICELLLEQEALCEELGEPPRALLADPLPTADEIQDFRKHLDSLRQERDDRMTKISNMRREIKGFLHILDLKVNTDTENLLLNDRHIKMNKETFEELKRLHSGYGAQVTELKDTINGMLKKLDCLWDRLNTSPNTRIKFKRFNDYNQCHYDVIYSEVQRCESLKRQNIKLYVQQIREEIRVMWDKTLKSEVQRNRFSNFTSTCFTDDLLVLHEMELEDLKSYYETNKHIFDLFADRNTLWERMAALEAKASEPGRYNNRGGQLLKEEKERKTIASKLPKIEQQIRDLVQEYEARERTPFLVYGESIVDVMAAQWEQKQKDKELVQSARKNAATKTPGAAAKPVNSTMRTPMRNASSVSSLRKTPSVTSLRKTPSASSLNVQQHAATTSSFKRKLNVNDRQTPVAKRSLMKALNSPSVFLKPANSQRINSNNNNNLLTSSAKTPNVFKSPFKKNRVIATTIRRRSNRNSGGSRKRKSLNKQSVKNVPKIIVDGTSSDDYLTDHNHDDETYGSFEKYIEPASRSSVLFNQRSYMSSAASSSSSLVLGSSRTKRMQQIVRDENQKITQLPNPRALSRTPSRQNLQHHTSTTNQSRTATMNRHSPVALTGSRKLTTKNLPIII